MANNVQRGPLLLQTVDLEVDFDGFKAVNGLNFSVHTGELRFLIGPNGAGKTTLLDVLCGKVKPSRGRVLYQDGIELQRLQEHDIAAKGIGRKFQAPSVFTDLSVTENLDLAVKRSRGIAAALFSRRLKAEQERVDIMLERIGLTERAGVKAGSLSHGEKQWLEIGMLLMQEPSLLLLDEPAAGMTDEETEKMGLFLRELSGERTIIVVEHDMEFVRSFANTVTVMHEGSILREGTMDEIRSDDRVAEVYLGRRGERTA